MKIKLANSGDYWEQVSSIKALTQNADHVDVKVYEGEIGLRQFLANMFNYYPGWVKFLYQIRRAFVRLLGMKQEGVPQKENLVPEDISMRPGERAGFFEVKAAEEDAYYVAGATESHLTAHLAVVQEPLDGGVNRFYVITIVHYHRWTGPVYFNVIRPFHHIVVNQMGLAGIGA